MCEEERDQPDEPIKIDDVESVLDKLLNPTPEEGDEGEEPSEPEAD